jgi:hypothetical protein
VLPAICTEEVITLGAESLLLLLRTAMWRKSLRAPPCCRHQLSVFCPLLLNSGFCFYCCCCRVQPCGAHP